MGNSAMIKALALSLDMKKLVFLFTLLLVACGERDATTATVERSQHGDQWPFTVEVGVLSCLEGRDVVFISDGKIYALNGIAMTAGKYAPLDDIWAGNPAIPGTKKNIRPIIDKGLAMCK